MKYSKQLFYLKTHYFTIKVVVAFHLFPLRDYSNERHSVQ